MPVLPLYQVDAFASKLFGGNPAAVCILKEWLADDVLQAIAAENNLSETAFLIGAGGDYQLRWFTPEVEVDLCGHATLGSAHIIMTELEPALSQVVFRTRQAGTLTVDKTAQGYRLDFPSRAGKPVPLDTLSAEVLKGLGNLKPREAFLARDLMLVFENEQEVRDMQPNFSLLRQYPHWIIVTAPARAFDFVSRFFAAGDGVEEDPVTGSAHCTLIPYWSKRLGKKNLHAFQASKRGGELFCEDLGERVKMAGGAVTYFKGEIYLS